MAKARLDIDSRIINKVIERERAVHKHVTHLTHDTGIKDSKELSGRISSFKAGWNTLYNSRRKIGSS